MIKQRNTTIIEKCIIAFGIIVGLLSVGLASAMIYVAMHFLQKIW